MDLGLTDEQVWLSESVGELVGREAADDGIVPPAAAERLWRSLGEFGALEVGDGLGAVELALVTRGLGARVAPVPYADTAAVHYALARAASLELPLGSAAPCLSEPGRSFAPTEPATSLDDGRLTGEKAAVAYAPAVDVFAVPAAGPEGLALALVPSTAAGVAISPEVTLDPTLRPALVRLDATEVGGNAAHASEARPLVERLAAAAGILAAAESVGAAAAVLELARTYATQRRQFGRPIGSFQALKHLLADMYVEVESSWSSVLYAAASLDEDESDSVRTASIARAYTARATRDVAHGALQVLGGIAFTAEHPAHRFLRRIVVRNGQFGTAREHERSVGRSLARELEVPA
jgi:alkylation response protein AidB-like acyl-CoA dehydrogenase